MANKPKITVTEYDPIKMHINKNGRPIQLATARLYARKTFPEVSDWKFEKTDHSILVTQIK